MRRILILLGLSAALHLPAGALLLAPVPFADLIDDAKAIVLGEVVAQHCERNAANGRIYTYYTVKVESDDKSVSDASAPKQVVVRMLGGTVGETSLVVSGQKMPDVGEKVYLFLETDTLNASHYRVLGMVQGYFQVVTDARTGETRAVGIAPEAAALDPKTRAQYRKKGGIDLSENVPLEAELAEMRAAVRQQVLRAQNPRYQVEKARQKAGGLPKRPAAPGK
ncbi:hypothetical protein HS125_02525 [bacterium]|nr:hypothetical protein [bacterium]